MTDQTTLRPHPLDGNHILGESYHSGVFNCMQCTMRDCNRVLLYDSRNVIVLGLNDFELRGLSYCIVRPSGMVPISRDEWKSYATDIRQPDYQPELEDEGLTGPELRACQVILVEQARRLGDGWAGLTPQTALDHIRTHSFDFPPQWEDDDKTAFIDKLVRLNLI
jgi:hypothetical protein